MTITVIGLGLIGGSLCKAIKAKTAHTCYGVNRNPAVLDVALKDGAIDRGFALEERLPASDVYVVCFHPRMTIDYIARRAGEFAPGSLVIDVCGVKSAVVEEAERALLPQGVRFLGTHPMAGREFSGYDYSLPTLYDGASIVLTPTAQSRPEDIELMKGLAAALGFCRTDLLPAGGARQDHRLYLPDGPCCGKRLCKDAHAGAARGIYRGKLSGHDPCGALKRGHVDRAFPDEPGTAAGGG